ncbi:unnamed protein product (macronuclear) [Paramecium tetraurelia]|uniref:Uncharacterized protein n=1 Tax=Paramecium tetraurelia TaxID=5888 RepID=A0BHX4_PARTE|nr:uncharacterized protein GSPATT00029177001 [Paramecium tetraurelia]CAK58141.1 unnamed protein product [Paramecium tetraurelia]|eukprot:XP_001425539.1 hypothetical protein (macronuclear) [Paramecium tetraurelia strain d4-2]
MNYQLSQVENEQSDIYIESQIDEYKKHFQMDCYALEDKVQFYNLNMNEPLDMKSPSETIQEFIFTEEKLEVQGKGLFNTSLNQHKLINIKLLDLSKCKLHQIPEDVKQMINLQKVYLSYNMLITLPHFLESLTFLEVLDLSYNQIQIYNVHLKRLMQLNLASNQIKQPYFGNLNVLCIQMNPITQLPHQFHNALRNLNQLEFDWFKYCKPPLPLKLNFKKYPWVQEKLINSLSKQPLSFQEFIQLLSQNQQNFSTTDYKERNLFCQAGINDEIGVLYCLNQIIPQDINKTDFDNYTPLSVCYAEGKMRSVSILKAFGGRFSLNSIHCMSQRADVQNLKFLLGIKEHVHFSLRASNSLHPINQESLVMLRNIDGNTPMHQLMMNFDKHEFSSEFALILLMFGADPNAENYEGFTPLEMAIKKQQVKGLKFGNDFNMSNNVEYLNKRFFDFSHQSTITGNGMCHTAATVGNLEILEFLISINADYFSISKSNKLPRGLAIQSLVALKNIRKLEKRYILNNVIREKSLLEQQEKNVYQMRHQIEKNMVQRHHNMIQKFVDQVEIDDSQSMESYNDFSLQVGSECSVRETVAESTPIFKKQQNLQKEAFSSVQQNVQQLLNIEFSDHYPDILKLLRNGNIDTAIKKLENILQYELICVSERFKYKNQLSLLKLKFKQKNVELKSRIGQDVQLLLNEYQFKQLKTDLRNKYFKNVQSILNNQNEMEISKALNIVSRQQIICSSFNLNRDLQVQDLSLISDLRNKLSANLVYDINNYATHLFSSQSQLYLWLYSCFSKKEKILVKTSFFNLQNYEYLQQMKFKKKRVIVGKPDDLAIDKDISDLNSVPINQIISNNNLFCNTKRN